MKKLTKHGAYRFKQRVSRELDGTKTYRKAVQAGYNKENFTGEFYNYLLNKSSNRTVLKIYNGKIYISSKNSKKLITVLKIPNKYLPIEKFILSENEKEVLYYPDRFMKREVIIKLKNGYTEKGLLVKIEYDENYISKSFTIKLYDYNVEVEIQAGDIESIQFDIEYINKELYELMNK